MNAPRNMLQELATRYQEGVATVSRRIVVCAGTGCAANGSLEVHDALVEALAEAKIDVIVTLRREESEPVAASGRTWVSKSGCQGFCQLGPLLTVEPDGILYTRVRIEDVPEIVAALAAGEVVERLLYQKPGSGQLCRGYGEIPFYQQQTRHVLKGCGEYEPADIAEYVAKGGYEAARRAYLEMTPEQVCEEVMASGLRGRGGGGFPTGRKWALTLAQQSVRKYVICNGDEGDPGAFMDRSVMEGNPHRVIEGMAIAARAIGACYGFVYVRMEYPLAVQRVEAAIEQAREAGVIGDHIFGTSLSFDLEVMEGAGAFVCGEETALIASVEGRRGMPNPKPPFPAERGLFEQPTVINNVETLAAVPLILRDGPVTFRKLGTDSSPGTKTFALTGHVANTGLIEVPFGTTLREIVFNIGGGVTDDLGKPIEGMFKAVQIGGPSGGCLTPEMLDLPLDFDSLKTVNAMVGSGGLVVMNRDTCMVQVARFFMQFTQNESCGKCVLCREGTMQMLTLLDDIIAGKATAETLTLLDSLARTVSKGSLCGLGKTAPNPVLSVLTYFREEIEAHVLDQKCPAKRCKALLTPSIDAELCKGCTICGKKCPVNAISGDKKQPHVIDEALCIKCGACAKACKFNAITGVN